MVERPFFVSKRLNPMPHTRDYRDPFTGLGVRLSAGTPTATDFILHEAGCLRYRDWNHRGIVSPYWRLHHNFTAGNSVACGGRLYPLRPEAALLTPAGVHIDTLGPRAPLHAWLHFTPTRAYQLALRGPLPVALPPALRALFAGFAALFRTGAAHAGHPGLYHQAQALLHGVFARVEPEVFQSFPAPLAALLARIQEHPAADLSNPALARLSGKSRARFAAWFREHTGHPPAAYVRRARVERAAGLLCLTEDSLEEIAAATGFPNRFHFTRVFTAQTGLAPATYRKRHQAGRTT